MLIRWGVRLGVALACAAGIVASLIARESRMTEQEAFRVAIEGGDPRRSLALLDDSRRLNPDFAIDLAAAQLSPPRRAVAILRKAAERDPDNAEVWLRLSEHELRAGDRVAARRSYARAR